MKPETKWKYAKEEQERKFLLVSNPIEHSYKKKKTIEDKYLHNSQLRIRKTTEAGRSEYKLTKKVLLTSDNSKGSDQSINHWVSTIYLSESEFRLLMGLEGDVLKKVRFYLELKDGRSVGIDEIKLGSTTIWIAEIEFDPETSKEVELPFEIEKEVTFDEKYYGSELAKLKLIR